MFSTDCASSLCKLVEERVEHLTVLSERIEAAVRTRRAEYMVGGLFRIDVEMCYFSMVFTLFSSSWS